MTDTDKVVAEAGKKIGAMGSAFYFTEPAVSKGAELGIGTLRLYFLGRGGVLGDVDAPVVHSAFGYFKAEFLAAQWDKGRAKVPPPEAARVYMECCAEFGRSKLSGTDGLAGLCDAMAAVNDAADPTSLALYAGIQAMPLADDLPGRAMQLVAVLREYRGSAHLVAIVAQRLDPMIAHYIRRPEMFGAFGYGEDEVPEVNDEDRAKLAGADALTDAIVARAYGVLDEPQREALLGGLAAMERALAG